MTAVVLPLRRWRPEIRFHVRLREVRRGYGHRLGRTVSQEEMAELIGVGKKAYAAWESGKNRPRDFESVVAKVSDATGCDRGWLAVGEEPIDVPPPPSDEYAPRDSNPEPSDSGHPNLTRWDDALDEAA